MSYTLENILESIVAGVCMTLAGKKTDKNNTDIEESEWVLPGESGVTDPLKVFQVQGISLAGKEGSLAVEGFQKISREMSPHWRRGHWAKNPKTGLPYWRSETIVRKDKLKEGELPKGTGQVIKDN